MKSEIGFHFGGNPIVPSLRVQVLLCSLSRFQSRRLDNHLDVRKHFHDLSGAPLVDVHQKLVALASRAKYFRKVKQIETFVVIPAHLGSAEEGQTHLAPDQNDAVFLQYLASYFAHCAGSIIR